MSEKKTIRFIDSHYNEKFTIEDGDEIMRIRKNGDAKAYKVKYIDNYHIGINGMCYHICEYAELLESYGDRVEPKDEYLKRENKENKENKKAKTQYVR